MTGAREEYPNARVTILPASVGTSLAEFMEIMDGLGVPSEFKRKHRAKELRQERGRNAWWEESRTDSFSRVLYPYDEDSWP